jgi:hypothetical protein
MIYVNENMILRITKKVAVRRNGLPGERTCRKWLAIKHPVEGTAI